MARGGAESGYERLKRELREKKLGSFYIFTGEETYLRDHYLSLVRRQLVDEATEEFNFHRFTSETLTPQALADSVEALPMMAQRSMVQVDDVDFFKLPEAQREQYAAIFSDIPDYCTVALVYETVAYKPDRRLKKLAAAMEKAVVAEFCRQSERELADWISRHFRKSGKSISYPMCQYLIQITGGTMTALRAEIGKLASYSEGGEITKADIDAVVEPVLDAVVFDLTDAIAAGNYALAVRKLETLLQMQEEPLNILGAISAQMRRILTAKTLLSGGKGMAELMQLCALKEYPARKTMEFARKLPQELCDKAALWCLDTDWKIKNSYDDPRRLLELLVLQLAQEAKHG